MTDTGHSTRDSLESPARLAPLWDVRRDPPDALRDLLRQATMYVVDLAFGREPRASANADDPRFPTAICQVSAIQGVDALLGKRSERGENIVNPMVSAWHRQQALFNRDRLRRIQGILDELLPHLEERSLGVVALKGAALLLRDGVETLSWRVTNDIDLLIQDRRTQEIDLAIAYAGFCLERNSWKHRVYARCTPQPWSLELIGGEGKFPLSIEVHPAIKERFRGSGWDLTNLVLADASHCGNVTAPGSIGMALHLAVHSSVSMLEGLSRAIHLIDLDRALTSLDPKFLLDLVGSVGIAKHARFIYPSLALTSRELKNSVAEALEEQLRPFVSPQMVRWATAVSVYDVSYPGRLERRLFDRTDLWATSRVDRLNMLASTLLPRPSTLAGESQGGNGFVTTIESYGRYYAGLAQRLREARRRSTS